MLLSWKTFNLVIKMKADIGAVVIRVLHIWSVGVLVSMIAWELVAEPSHTERYLLV
jgi:hypothetical protein